MITIQVRGTKELEKFLKKLPTGAKQAAIVEYADYLIGNDARGLSHYPPRVTHGKNNPYKWESAKQRRAYFATNGFGDGIPYQRSGALKRSWMFEKPGWNVWRGKIVNKLAYAKYVMGDEQQRGHKADKWRKAQKVIKDNMSGAIKSAQRAVDRWARTK